MATWSTQAALRECQMTANGELTVVERLEVLLQTGQFADVNVRVGKGNGATVFKAHKLLLATASQPLHRLVCGSSKLAQYGNNDMLTIRVADVDPSTFRHVLQYIYTDDLNLTSISEAFALLRVSRRWGLKALGDRTKNFLMKFLGDFNGSTEDMKNDLCDLVILTEEEGGELHDKCFDVLIRHAEEIIPCQGFLNMSEDLVKKTFRHPDFSFKNHLTLFEAIKDWGMNQIVQNSLSVNKLQTTVSNLMEFVKFDSIQDGDFLNTVLPSDCLGKSDIIAYFMAHCLKIPRQLDFKNKPIQNGIMEDNDTQEKEDNDEQKKGENDVKKACRFRRGYKLPEKEIYKEHELRFRVNRRLKLLGVCFGFLFSNTDMGITVHCQGPWEVRQWTDIVQTYCRVSWEKMKTADVQLMFAEPVTIEANQSYKILVRIGRMTAGSSEVDLWGGTNGLQSVNTDDAEIFFLKAAVDPSKEVDTNTDTESRPGMITELLYQLDDGLPSVVQEPTPLAPRTRRTPIDEPEQNDIAPVTTGRWQQRPVETSVNRRSFFSETSSRRKPSIVTIEEKENAPANARKREVSESSSSSYNYHVPALTRKVSVEDQPYLKGGPSYQKKPETEIVSSYYLPKAPTSINSARPSDTFSSLRSRSSIGDTLKSYQFSDTSNYTSRSSVADVQRSWDPIAKSRTGYTDTSSLRSSVVKPREPSLTRYGRETTPTSSSSRFTTGSSKFGDLTGSSRISSTASRFGSLSSHSSSSSYGTSFGRTGSSFGSRFGSSYSSASYTPVSSRFTSSYRR